MLRKVYIVHLKLIVCQLYFFKRELNGGKIIEKILSSEKKNKAKAAGEMHIRSKD